MTNIRARLKATLLVSGGLLLAACGATTPAASSPAASVAAKASAPASAVASVKPAASAAASVSAKPAASAAASGAAKPAASGPAIGTVYSFEAADFSFNGPASIQGGLVTLLLKNTGKEPHLLQLMKLNTGGSMDQFTAVVATQQEGGIFRQVSS